MYRYTDGSPISRASKVISRKATEVGGLQERTQNNDKHTHT